jgi:Recombination directionality factor-like
MPILTLQRQMRELGRIRTGNQVTSANGKRRPAKLDTFRLTSESRALVDAAAAAYGGTVTPWDNNGSAEFEVITTTASLDIVVPPGQPVSQWYELWSGGGCLRRCDGVTNVLTMQPCECPADVEQRLELAKKGEACKATTRLNVMLPALPDLGVWRLESHGFYAAVELAGAAEILAMASATGRLIPARLRLEQREKKVPGQPTNKYAVPIIEFVETRMADLQIVGTTGGGHPALTAGERPARPALPSTTVPATSDMRAPMAKKEEEPVETATETDTRAVPPPLTQAELIAALGESGISVEYAVEAAKARWPNLTTGGSLTAAQRGELLAALRAETQPVAGL